MYLVFFIDSSVDGHLGCFHLLVTVNNASVNMGVQIFLWDPGLNSLGSIPRGGVAGSHGNSIGYLFTLLTAFFDKQTFLNLV